MCGSPKITSVDHILPKELYPEFSIYSKNLVPACDCNIKRKTTLMNRVNGVRVLHPYFDDCLSVRQLSCSISIYVHGSVPEIKIEYVDPNHPLITSLQFHYENIVKKSGIIGWLESQWDSLMNLPESVIQTFPSMVMTDQEMNVHLQRALRLNDISYGTPNNWYSIFIHGVLNSQAIKPLLLQTHNGIYEDS
jgi:hypothetical protein